MLTDLARRFLKTPIDALADLLARLGVTPNGLTLTGASLHLLVLWALARGDFLIGGLLMLLASGLDGIDGTLARRTGLSSPFGAFLDSTLDRLAEILVYLGLLLYAQEAADGGPLAFEPWLVYLALTGSIMVSYSRARAEGAGFQARSGVFTRLERMTTLWLGLLSGWVAPALWIVAAGSWLTTLQRVLEVWRESRGEAPAAAGEREAVT